MLGLKPFPDNGFAAGPTAAVAALPVDWSTGAARKTVVVELESVQPVSFPTPSAAMPPSSAQATATAANGPVRKALAL